MPTLIRLAEPTVPTTLQGNYLREYAALRDAGEALVLWTPLPPEALPPLFAPVTSASTLHRLLEDEAIPVVVAAGIHPPSWLSMDEFYRVLLIAEGVPDDVGNYRLPEWRLRYPDQQSIGDLAASMLAAGCEAVEVCRPDQALDLSQSWTSGRRVGVRLQ